MSIIKAVVHLPSGEFRNKDGNFECGPFEPQRPVLSVQNGIATFDPDYDVVTVQRRPDYRTERWDGATIVAKDTNEIARHDIQIKNAQRQKLAKTRDVLTWCGMSVRSRDVPAWNKMSTQQKLDAINTEIKAWHEVRQLIEANFKEQ